MSLQDEKKINGAAAAWNGEGVGCRRADRRLAT
nr:MAG TPA: hypothetical protein [Caudoviricetes sp.]